MSGAWCTTLAAPVCTPVSVAIFAAEPSFGPNPVVDSGWLVGGSASQSVPAAGNPSENPSSYTMTWHIRSST